MSVPNPPEVGTAPSPAPTTQDTENFDARADAFHAFFPNWLNVLFPAVLQWIKDRANDVYGWATAAYTSATSAAASATAAAANAANAAAANGATAWVSGTTYAAGVTRWSPITGRTYRRLTAGAGTTDPSLDPTNWLALSVVVEQVDVGTAPGQIPLNQYLGNMAYMASNAMVINPVALAVPAGVGDMVYQLTNDTTLVIKVKGSDGTVRSATLTLS